MLRAGVPQRGEFCFPNWLEWSGTSEQVGRSVCLFSSPELHDVMAQNRRSRYRYTANLVSGGTASGASISVTGEGMMEMSLLHFNG